MTVHIKKIYRMNDNEKRTVTRNFYTGPEYGVNGMVYNNNEAPFFLMIHNTVKDTKLETDYKIKA